MTDTLDPEKLAALAAIAEKAVNGTADAPGWPEGATWCVVWRGSRWYSTDALAAHACAVAEAVGHTGWDSTEPATSPTHLAAWIAAFVSSETQIEFADALQPVLMAPLDDLKAALEVRS